jgi:choline dehydrogenase-like flavoprotein
MIDLPEPGAGDLELSVEVVVVGSGAGGATAAAVLAAAGRDVLCLEEGDHHPTVDNTTDVPEMMARLMRDAGLTTITGPRQTLVPYLEGCCVGGTTVINGGMCWRTPERVLEEWQARGLHDLSLRNLAPLFQRVEEVISARHQDPGSEGGNSLLFQRGAERLGWRYRRNQRNQVHCVGSNDCVTGCPTGAKQSVLETWVPRFLAAGGKLVSRARAEKISIDRNGRAAGVTGTVRPRRGGPRRLRVRARAVILAGGAIQTPLLLLRNRLGRRGSHIGRHFTIHPNAKVGALFPQEIDPLHGTHQAFQITEFTNEGILLAPGALPLALVAMTHATFGPRLAEELRHWRHLALGGVLVEDHGEGRISLLAGRIPRVRYGITPEDQVQFARAVSKLAELYFAAGASVVYTPFHALPELHRVEEISKIFALRPRVSDTEYFTAHLMGTCRMAASADGGVVRPDGEMWGLPGLYLADASVMPGPIGVNPQVTIMALAHLIAQQLSL